MRSKKKNIKIINNLIDTTNFQQLPKRLQRRIQKFGNSAICPSCGSLLQIQALKNGRLHCSIQCRAKGQQLKQLARKNNSVRDYSKTVLYFSTEQGRRHAKEKLIEKYGVDNVFKLKQTQNLIKQQNLQKYGVQCIFSKIPQNISQQQRINLVNSQQKIKETNIQKYGTEFPLQNQIIKEIAKSTIKENNLQKYGVQYKAWLTIEALQDVQPLFTIQQYIGLNRQYLWKCKYCGCQFKSIYNAGGLNTKCQCQKLKHTSKLQIQLADFCSQYFDIKRNWNGLIWPQELDIVIPQIKVALEFNGLYWHQQIYKNKFYHYQKSVKCRQLGYRLIHIWQDQWINQKQTIKQKLLKAFKKQQIYQNGQIINFSWNNILNGKLICQPYIEYRNQFKIWNCGIFQYIQP